MLKDSQTFIDFLVDYYGPSASWERRFDNK